MRKLLRTALAVMMSFALSGTILCWADGELPVWYESARRFVETTARLVDEANIPGSNALELLNAQETAVKNLKGLPNPSVKELNRLIQSTRVEEREAALATAMVLKLKDSSLIKTVLLNYQQEQGFLAKFYSQHVLANITASQPKEVKEQLFKILQREKDEPIIIAGLQNVERMDKEKRTALFIQYMRNGSDGLLRACTVTLIKLGKTDLEDVKTGLRNEGADKALSFLNQFSEMATQDAK